MLSRIFLLYCKKIRYGSVIRIWFFDSLLLFLFLLSFLFLFIWLRLFIFCLDFLFFSNLTRIRLLNRKLLWLWLRFFAFWLFLCCWMIFFIILFFLIFWRRLFTFRINWLNHNLLINFMLFLNLYILNFVYNDFLFCWWKWLFNNSFHFDSFKLLNKIIELFFLLCIVSILLKSCINSVYISRINFIIELKVFC